MNSLARDYFGEVPAQLKDVMHMKSAADIHQLVEAAEAATSDYLHPQLVMIEQRLRDNARRFLAAMPRVRAPYAVKANPQKEVLGIFAEEGLSFEIASPAELQDLLDLGVPAKEVFYSNPIKAPVAIDFAHKAGVEWYSVDTPEEIEKIAAIAPDAKLYIRTEVSNEGSFWPLSGKFGVTVENAGTLIECAKRLDMALVGVTFHVGSQCTNIDNWKNGIATARRMFAMLEEAGFTPELLNLGGGYPVQFSGDEPSIEEVAAVINAELESIPESIQVMAEPGRFLVASAGCLVAKVVGTASRDQERWMYQDVGVYNGLIEMKDDFPFLVISNRIGENGCWTLAGPTCDSIDVFRKNAQLPENIQADDMIYIPYIGAYCSCCGSAFNGFPVPEIKIV